MRVRGVGLLDSFYDLKKERQGTCNDRGFNHNLAEQ